MNPQRPREITLEMIRKNLYSAVVSDALDGWDIAISRRRFR